MADFMRRCKGEMRRSTSDHSDIRRVFVGFHMERLNIPPATPTRGLCRVALFLVTPNLRRQKRQSPQNQRLAGFLWCLG
ncbi:hypothetical protein ACWWJ2_31475, partial [Pseudomonas aeruginosa]